MLPGPAFVTWAFPYQHKSFRFGCSTRIIARSLSPRLSGTGAARVVRVDSVYFAMSLASYRIQVESQPQPRHFHRYFGARAAPEARRGTAPGGGAHVGVQQ